MIHNLKKIQITVVVCISALFLLLAIGCKSNKEIAEKKFDQGYRKDPAAMAARSLLRWPRNTGAITTDSSGFKQWKKSNDSLLDILSVFDEMFDSLEPTYITDTVPKECEPYKDKEHQYIGLISSYIKEIKQLKVQLSNVKPIIDSVPYPDLRVESILRDSLKVVIIDRDHKVSVIDRKNNWIIGLIIGLSLCVVLIVIYISKKAKGPTSSLVRDA